MGSKWRELVRYFSMSCVGAVCNLLALSIVASFDGFLLHVPAYIVGAIVGLAVNYSLYNNFVFVGRSDRHSS